MSGESAGPQHGLHESASLADELKFAGKIFRLLLHRRKKLFFKIVDVHRRAEFDRGVGVGVEQAVDCGRAGQVIGEAEDAAGVAPAGRVEVQRGGVRLRRATGLRCRQAFGLGDLRHASRVALGHPRPDGVAVDGQHVEPGRGKAHRVAADAAAHIGDVIEARSADAFGFVLGRGERTGLFNARRVGDQLLGLLREFGHGFLPGLDQFQRDRDLVLRVFLTQATDRRDVGRVAGLGAVEQLGIIRDVLPSFEGGGGHAVRIA